MLATRKPLLTVRSSSAIDQVDVGHRDHRNAEKAVRRVVAEFGKPVVEDRRAVTQYPGVGVLHDEQHARGVQHLATNTGFFLELDAHRRIPACRLKADFFRFFVGAADFQHLSPRVVEVALVAEMLVDRARNLIAPFIAKRLVPHLRRFHHMRVAGNDVGENVVHTLPPQARGLVEIEYMRSVAAGQQRPIGIAEGLERLGDVATRL